MEQQANNQPQPNAEIDKCSAYRAMNHEHKQNDTMQSTPAAQMIPEPTIESRSVTHQPQGDERTSFVGSSQYPVDTITGVLCGTSVACMQEQGPFCATSLPAYIVQTTKNNPCAFCK